MTRNVESQHGNLTADLGGRAKRTYRLTLREAKVLNEMQGSKQGFNCRIEFFRRNRNV